MKSIILAPLLLIFAPWAIAQNDVIACIQSADSQDEINQSLSLEWRAVENQLKQLYGQLEARYTSADFEQRLKAVKEAHEAYVDALLNLKYPPGAQKTGGDTHDGCVASTLVEYTRPHVLNLETYLTESEGGICRHWN